MDTLASLLNGNVAYAFAWTMIHSLWQCAIIALLLWGSLAINRSQSARLRYLQALAAMIACVLVSLATFAHLYESVRSAEAVVGTPLVLRYSGDLWEQTYGLLNQNLPYLLMLWFVGFIVQFVKYASDFLQARRLCKVDCEAVPAAWSQRCRKLAGALQINRNIIMKNSSRVSSICVIGHLRPVILLPIGMLTNLSTEQVEALLLHELAHIRRNDYLVNAAQGFVRLLYFFNPAVLWISKQIDIERENACDDIAVAQCGDPRLYAESLASISVLELRLASVLAAKNRGGKLLPRVKRLFSRSSGVTKSMEQLASGIAALGLILAMNVSAGEFSLLPEEQPSAASPTISAALPAVQAQPAPVKLSQPAQPVPVAKPVKAALAEVPEAPTAPAASDMQTLAVTPQLDYAAKLAEQQPIQLAQLNTPKQKKTPKTEPVKLEPMSSPEFDQFLLANSFSAPTSRKIMIDNGGVQFADVWLKRFRKKTSNSYRDYVQQEYGDTLIKELSEAFAEMGWQVVESADEDTVRLKAQLINLYIFEPDSSGIKQTIISIAGQAGVQLEFSNPQAETFMQIVDHRNTDDTAGSPVIANRSTNLLYFKRLMSDWSKVAALYTEEVIKVVENKKQ